MERKSSGDKDFAETSDDTSATSEEIKAVAEQINKKLAESYVQNLNMEKRSTECETVFGQTKGNLGFRR